MSDTTSTTPFTEAQLEAAIIQVFTAQGYAHVSGETVHRKFEDILLEDDLRGFLSARHPELTETEISRAISLLQNIPSEPLYCGNREAFWLVTEGFDFQRDDSGKPALHIDFIDFATPENNTFKVVSQYAVQGERLRRPDVLVFINGILVTIFEFKTAIAQDKTTHDAWEQICRRYRQTLDKRFKDNESNFQIALVVDMWITGFDVPSLAVMYIDKPLQKHSLIQAISRVNRVFDGKDMGLVVDYIGIRDDMLAAVKQYGGPLESPIDELKVSLAVFRNHLALIDALFVRFNAVKFFAGGPFERLLCLNHAAEYAQISKDTETRFMGLSRKLKAAYDICFQSGELTDEETARAQFYLAVRSIIYKQTKGDAPDAEVMNSVVEKMVCEAITCTGIENIVNASEPEELFGDEFMNQLEKVKLPISKFNALLKLLRKVISGYGRINKLKALEFDKRLKDVVDSYNSRDKLVFTSEVVADFINGLSDELIEIFAGLQADKTSFEKLGITYEEKAFYDILVKVRDDHGFPYADDKCLALAKKIKELVDDKSQFADWSTRDDIKSQLNMDLTVLLYKNGYPPEWDEEVFEKVMEQAENFKRCAVWSGASVEASYPVARSPDFWFDEHRRAAETKETGGL